MKNQGYQIATRSYTGHNSADSVPTSNLVCIKEVAIRTTFRYILINIAGIIYYTCSLVIDIQCTVIKMPSINIFNKYSVSKQLCYDIFQINSNRTMKCGVLPVMYRSDAYSSTTYSRGI